MIHEDYKKYFEGKKITVMGLGLLGRGVGDAVFLAECGAELIVTDLKTQEQLASSVAQLKQFENVTFVLGEHKLEDFENRDMILVAAGVPSDSLYLTHAKEHGVPLEMSAAIFARIAQIPIIGVTGTRGKSTVAHMIHHVLMMVTGEPVILGGNIRGVSNLQLLKEVNEDSIAVFELDSWQLQGFGWAHISPQIAVFTNFMPDHLNYYHGDLTAYFLDKAQIFLHQEESDVLITTPDVLEQAKKCALEHDITLGQEVVLVDASVLPEDLTLRILGEHNRLNAALAYEALQALSLTEEEIVDGLATFAGVSGRLEYVSLIQGVTIYNDNNATTPQATLAGLRAVGKKGAKNIVLIMGGTDKNLSVDELVKEIPEYCKEVILVPGSGSDKVKSLLKVHDAETLAEAVSSAMHLAEDGDVVLFSPAFASFGAFANEYERNDAFVDIVSNL